jgi:hypothetical protein
VVKNANRRIRQEIRERSDDPQRFEPELKAVEGGQLLSCIFSRGRVDIGLL